MQNFYAQANHATWAYQLQTSMQKIYAQPQLEKLKPKINLQLKTNQKLKLTFFKEVEIF